ncbi:MAG: enoyl-CoA hydratase/isomerase family protein [Deltaproteobacteria bacterium]|nr:enoyl-CoA hydratase/isomerase family protein [Deltaproteobacteria bacterium]MBI4197293.1 enoyl-CoA hydratase/isomerase family protein [Deltaproteobacteria bacterium]
MSILLSERQGAILSLTLNRPEKANALSTELIEALHLAFQSAEKAADLLVITLTGVGGNFCSGADTDEFKKGAEGRRRAVEGYCELVQSIQQFSKPFLVGVEGGAVGGGLGLVALADLVIASEKAHFRTPELTLGLFPFIISPLLVPVIGKKHFFEMVYTGRPVGSDQAREWGLVNEVVTSEMLGGSLFSLAGLIAKAPLETLQRGKRTVREGPSFQKLGEELLALLGRSPLHPPKP